MTENTFESLLSGGVDKQCLHQRLAEFQNVSFFWIRRTELYLAG